ncbi:MAG: hypothetical protein VB048_07610, partial [Bacteroidaceae bacterium]|nr:hypothetical protein [Bacteroidaceae bacterium]
MVSLADLGQPAKNIARLIFLIIIIAVLVAIFQSTKDLLISKGILPATINHKKLFVQNLNFDYKITRVIDGDTIQIKRLDGKIIENTSKEMKVRLIGI